MTDQRHESPPESTASGAQPSGRNLFISSLGVLAYEPVVYGAVPGEAGYAGRVRFVQEARLRALAASGVVVDRVVTLFTVSSGRANYGSAVRVKPHANNQDAHKACADFGDEGYEAALGRLGFDSTRRDPIDFPDLYAPKDLWALFELLDRVVQNTDSIYLDVTHGFRAVPFLMFFALDYVCRAKGATLAQVTYGAYEAKDLGGNNGVAPIFDLTPFLRLQRWTDAVVRAESGDLRAVAGLTSTEMRGLKRELAEQKRLDETPSALARLGRPLEALADALLSNRLEKLPRMAHDAVKAIDAAKGEASGIDAFKPLVSLLDRLRDDFAPLAADRDAPLASLRLAQIEAAKWCFERKLHTQAVVLVRELGVFGYRDSEGLSQLAADQRFGAVGAAVVAGGARRADTTAGVPPSLVDVTSQVQGARNAYMHAHTLASYSTQTLEANLPKWIAGLRELYDSTTSDARPSTSSAARSTTRLHVLMSHPLTDDQVTDADASLGVASGGIVRLSESDVEAWSAIDPESVALPSAVTDVVERVLGAASPGDFVLVQGEPGAVTLAVAKSVEAGLVPVYSTTLRESIEEAQPDGSVIKRSRFRHCRFRRYPVPDSTTLED